MARGESPSGGERPINMAFVGAFGVVALGALLFVVVVTRACDSCDGWMYASYMPTDPYVGASTAANLLSWRDTSRLRWSRGVASPDGTAAAAAVEADMRARGYGEPSATLPALTLPGELTIAELDRSCGVLLIEGEATSLLTAAGRPSGLRTADDPSAIALGACGEGPYRIEGVGTAIVRVYLVPGMVEADLERTGLPEDVLLAHAEAEMLLDGVAYGGADELIRIDVPAGTTSFSLPAPATGCVPWAIVVVGGGHTRVMMASWVMDYASTRGLALAVSCAGTLAPVPQITDDAVTGYTVWARPYGVSTTPRVPTEHVLTIGNARVVDVTALRLPASVPATPPP